MVFPRSLARFSLLPVVTMEVVCVQKGKQGVLGGGGGVCGSDKVHFEGWGFLASLDQGRMIGQCCERCRKKTGVSRIRWGCNPVQGAGGSRNRTRFLHFWKTEPNRRTTQQAVFARWAVLGCGAKSTGGHFVRQSLSFGMGEAWAWLGWAPKKEEGRKTVLMLFVWEDNNTTPNFGGFRVFPCFAFLAGARRELVSRRRVSRYRVSGQVPDSCILPCCSQV